jgi:hypothetical protein
VLIRAGKKAVVPDRFHQACHPPTALAHTHREHQQQCRSAVRRVPVKVRQRNAGSDRAVPFALPASKTAVRPIADHYHRLLFLFTIRKGSIYAQHPQNLIEATNARS